MPIRSVPFASGSSRRPAGPSCRGGASSLLRQGQGAALHRPAPARMAGWRANVALAGGAVEHVLSLPAAWPLSATASRL